MSTAGQKEVLGAVEIVVGLVIDAATESTAGDWLIQMGIETMAAGGLQELANLLAPSPLPAAQNGIVRSTVAAQQIIYGQVKAGGVVIFSDSYSTNNQYLDVAVAHTLTRANGSAGMAVQGIQGFYVNDVFIPVNTGSGGWNSSDGSITAGTSQPYNSLAGNLWIYFHDGSQTTVDSELNTNFGSYWKTTAVGKGVCYSVFKMFNSTDQSTFQAAYPQGIPNMLGVVLSGQKIYDPRLDSTNGGTGSQRLVTPSTWTFSSNPALIAADYLLRAKSDGGCGFASSVMNWASVAAAANICDTNVTVPAYGATWNGTVWSSTVTQAQYACNIGIDTGQNCDQNLRSILDCMAGVCVVATGQLYLYAGAPTSSSGSFDETYLAGEIQLTNETPRQSRWNAVKATYGQDPACDYQQQAAAPYFNTSYITADGGVTLLKSITLPGVTNQFTAQYLEIIETQRSRNKQIINAKCNLKMLQYQAWDVVSVTIAEYGLSSAPFRIISFSLNADLSVSVILQQEQSGTYTVSLSQFSEFDPPSLTMLGVIPGAPAAPSSLTASALAGGVLLNFVQPAQSTYQYLVVYRAPDVSGSPGTFAELVKCVGDSYLDTTAVSGTKYWYYLTAVNRWLQTSANSNQATNTATTSPTSPSLPNVIGSTATFNVTAAGWYEVALTDNATYADYRTAFNATVTVVNGATQGTDTFNVTNDSTGLKAALTLQGAANATPITQARVRTDGANHTALDVYVNWTTGTIAIQVAVAPVTGAWNGASAQAGLAATAGTVQQTLNMDPASTGTGAGGTGHIGPGGKWHLATDDGTVYHGGTKMFDSTQKIVNTVPIAGRTEGIGTTTQQLNSTGQLVSADQVAADGSTFVRRTLVVGGGSHADVPNVDFSLPNSANNVPGWVNHGSIQTFYIQNNSPAPPTGQKQYMVILSPASGAGEVDGTDYIGNLNPLDKVSVTATYNPLSGVTVAYGVNFYDKNGNYTGNCVVQSATAGWRTDTVNATVPANTTYGVRVAYVAAASSYGLFSIMRITINDTRVVGSGATLGDPRNSIGILASGLRAQWSGTQLTSAAYPAVTPTNQKIILSGTLYAGGAAISYGPTTLLGLPNTSVTYWVFFKDAAMAGGNPTLYATTSDPNISGNNTYSQDNGYIFAGKVTTVAGGNANGGGGGGLPP